MTIYLATYSALEALAAVAQSSFGRASLFAAEEPRWSVLHSADIAALARRCPFLTKPVSLVVPDISYRRNLRDASFRVCKQVRRPSALWNLSTKLPETTDLPADSSQQHVETTLGVSSPALCLTQLSPDLPLVQLTELACALAGRYRFAPSPTGSIIDATPITTTRAMSAFLHKSQDIPGAARARRALDLAIDDLGSPSETALYLLLCLPKREGGLGFRKPTSNSSLFPSMSRRKIVSQQRFHPDLFWEDARLIVEYDSSAYHRAPDQAALDSKRRNDLEALGFSVIVVTRDILRNDQLFGNVSEQIRLALGERSFLRNEGWAKRHAELRKQLLFPEPNSRRWR